MQLLGALGVGAVDRAVRQVRSNIDLLMLQCFDTLGQFFQFACFLVAGLAGGFRFFDRCCDRTRRCGNSRLGGRNAGLIFFNTHPILVAADVFHQLAVALERDHLRDDVVEERAVMADQEQCAVILRQQFFEQLQRLDVEIVGRFVEHQHIGGTGEQARQQQTVALAAGTALDRRTGAFRRKQEIAEVADDVFLLPADLDEIRALADGVGQCRLIIELLAQLVEIRHRDLGAQLDAAAVRL